MRLCGAHRANWREVWGSWVGAGGLWLPTETQPGCSMPGTSIQSWGGRKKATKLVHFLYPEPFVWCFSQLRVSGNNINQAWHKGKCLPSLVSPSLPLLVVTNPQIFFKFSKEVSFYLIFTYIKTTEPYKSQLWGKPNQLLKWLWGRKCQPRKRSAGLWEGAVQKSVQRCQI